MASAVIGALRVNLGLDSAEFRDGMKQAQSSADKFAKALKAGLAAAATAATAALGAISIGIRNTINSADRLGDVADMLGVNVEALQELRYAADRSGMSMQNFDIALRRFIRRASEAARGTGAAKDAFKELGISLRDSNGRLKPSQQLLGEVADAMRKVQDPAAKLRLAFKMFDTDGAAMVNVLAGGSEGLRQFADEARKLGIVLDESTVRKAQQVKDNFDLVGYAMQGLVTGITAALAPALVAASEAMVKLSQAFVDALQYLPAVAEYASVAGGALALMLAPSIIAAAGNLALAIGTGLVGAVRLLTAAIAANPLGALAIGITAAVTAIYHFRDEIQKAIGIDVVGIVKDAANLVIGSFVAAFEDIKFVWNNFGNVIGAAVIGGVNVAIRAINSLVATAKLAVNDVIQAFNMIPGVEIGTFDVARDAIKPLENPYAERLRGAIGDRNAAISAALSTDYIGAIGIAFQGSTPAVQDFAGALGDVNDQLNDIGGGGKGGKGKKDGAADKAARALERMREAMQSAKASLGQGFSSILEGLVNKTLSWKDAIVQAGQALLRYLNQMNIAQGGSGLFGGGFLQGLVGSLLGFKDGGSFTVGGTGGTDSQLVAFRATPGEMVEVRKGNQARGGGALDIRVGVSADNNGNLLPFVESVSRREASKAAGEVARNVPKMVDRRVDTRNTRGTRP